MSEDSSQFKVYIPPELHRLVNADARNNGEVAKAALWREYGGEKKGALEQRVEEIEDREENIKNEIQNRKDELEELNIEKQHYMEKIDELENGFIDDEDYNNARELLDEGERLFDTHDFVESLANKYDADENKVLDELKDELDYPDVAFRLAEVEEAIDWRRVDGVEEY